MKKIQLFAILASILYQVSCDLILNEPPNCNKLKDIRHSYIRNINNPRQFWVCFAHNNKAKSLYCPNGQIFDHIQGKCADIKVHSRAATEGHDGRPGCKTDLEMTKIYWRNNNDPTKYWKCLEKNQPGIAVNCPEGFAYVERVQICITLDKWEWSPPNDPPSFA